MLKKRLLCTDVCLKAEEELKFDPFLISELFKKFYSNLTNDLVKKLPAAAGKFDIKAVKNYYNMFDLSHNKLNSQTVIHYTLYKSVIYPSNYLTFQKTVCKLAKVKPHVQERY